MVVSAIDPIEDTRWAEFVNLHPRASVFHTPGWLEALRRTYGFESIALTTDGRRRCLATGLPFCRVRSWMTGSRIVALPFSDHCEPLVDTQEQLQCLLTALESEMAATGAQHIELRPLTDTAEVPSGLERATRFLLHRLNLTPGLDEVFGGFHKDCVQRKIRRAEREGLVCEGGVSASILRKFYGLLLATRRRHGLPPQPLAWFQNLVDCMGDKVCIRIASWQSHPVAGIFTLYHRRTWTYKYAVSDERFHHLGGIQLLIWSVIRDAVQAFGATEFDMGRSDLDNTGLIEFKDRWGAARSVLSYWRYPAGPATSPIFRRSRMSRFFSAHAPDSVLIAVGKLLYRHMG